LTQDSQPSTLQTLTRYPLNPKPGRCWRSMGAMLASTCMACAPSGNRC